MTEICDMCKSEFSGAIGSFYCPSDTKDLCEGYFLCPECSKRIRSLILDQQPRGLAQWRPMVIPVQTWGTMRR